MMTATVCGPTWLRVLEIPSVNRFVNFGRVPTALPDDEINALRNGLSGQLRGASSLEIGCRVRIIRGPLENSEGILFRNNGDFRLVLSIDPTMRSVAGEVGAKDVVPISGSRIPVVDESISQ
jgi:transcription antitermination factor NusG